MRVGVEGSEFAKQGVNVLQTSNKRGEGKKVNRKGGEIISDLVSSYEVWKEGVEQNDSMGVWRHVEESDGGDGIAVGMGGVGSKSQARGQ